MKSIKPSKTLLKRAVSFENKYFKDYGINEGLRHLFSGICNSKINTVPVGNFDKESITGQYFNGEIFISSVMIGEEQDLVLIHEMVHYYEAQASDRRGGTQYLTEYLSFLLRDKLAEQLPLKDIIEYELYSMAPLHTYFFILMSIDLDLKLNKPPGTIYGYGKSEAWKRYCGL